MARKLDSMYYDLGLPMDESLRRLVHKDPKAERAMQEMREYLDPEGEYVPTPRRRRSGKGAARKRS
jgi:hypothetical protein